MRTTLRTERRLCHYTRAFGIELDKKGSGIGKFDDILIVDIAMKGRSWVGFGAGLVRSGHGSFIFL